MTFKTADSVNEASFKVLERVSDNLQLVLGAENRMAVVISPVVGKKRYAFGKSNKETRAYFRYLKRQLAHL